MALEDLATELSNRHEYQLKLADRGISGTYIVTQQNKPLAVFKDAAQEPLCENNPRLQPKINRFFLPILKWFGVYGAVENTVTGQAYIGDYLTYEIAKKVKLNYADVPETLIVDKLHLYNQECSGSLLAWVEDAEPLSLHTDHLGRLNKIPKDIKLQSFEEMAIIDYATGNMDRKAENLLLSKKDNKIYLIDNSWAFSPLQGETLARNQYLWSKFPALSNQTFSPDSQNLIEFLYRNRHDLASEVFNTYFTKSPPGETLEISYLRAMCFLHRIELMHFLICKKNETFGCLGAHIFEDQFLDAKEKHSDLEFSSHFIDTKTMYLSRGGIQAGHKEIFTVDAEYRYHELYKSKNKEEPLISDNHPSPSELALVLKQEIERLNKKQASRNLMGFWRKAYAKKAVEVNNAMFDLEKADTGQKDINQRLEDACRDTSSPLYKALSRHSLFFKFSPSFMSKDTHAIANIKSCLK